MNYSIEAPAKKHKSWGERLWGWALSITAGAGLAGVLCWAWLQATAVAAALAFSTPTVISTHSGDIACVRWRTEISCVSAPEEPMPEPLAEMSYEEAKEMMAKILKPKQGV